MFIGLLMIGTANLHHFHCNRHLHCKACKHIQKRRNWKSLHVCTFYEPMWIKAILTLRASNKLQPAVKECTVYRENRQKYVCWGLIRNTILRAGNWWGRDHWTRSGKQQQGRTVCLNCLVSRNENIHLAERFNTVKYFLALPWNWVRQRSERGNGFLKGFLQWHTRILTSVQLLGISSGYNLMCLHHM